MTLLNCVNNIVVPEGGQTPPADRRKKRSTARRYIEMSVFVDPSMVKFHGDRLEQYVHTVVNVVSSSFSLNQYLSHDTIKPTKWLCAQRRPRSDWASAQSDQSLRCALNG